MTYFGLNHERTPHPRRNIQGETLVEAQLISESGHEALQSPLLPCLTLTVHNQPIDILLSSYLNIVCERKTKDCARLWSFQNLLPHLCYGLGNLEDFITSSLRAGSFNVLFR